MDFKNKEEEVLATIQQSVNGLTYALIKEMDSDPLFVAAALASTAMRLYKTALSPEDYVKMIDTIAETKDNVLPFTDAPTGPVH